MKLHESVTNKKSIMSFKNLENTFNNMHDNKYDYSNTIYKGMNKLITYICPSHGEYTQKATAHKVGKKCYECAKEDIKNKQKNNIKDVINKCNKKHKNKYDYSKFVYVNYNTKGLIICDCKNEFMQTMGKHLNTGRGCPKCGIIKNGVSNRLSFQDVVIKANNAHNNKYDYSSIENYTITHNKYKIVCNIHGEFMQQMTKHLSGDGCPKCQNMLSQEEVIKRFKKVHGNKYNYSLVDYKNNQQNVNIICNVCKKTFSQIPSNHWVGQGCPSCALTGFDQTRAGILYYLSINNGMAYKIGITNKTIKERFKADMQYIKVIHTWSFENGYDALKKEQSILKEFKKYKYRGADLLKNGNTELFNIDVLGLDF